MHYIYQTFAEPFAFFCPYTAGSLTLSFSDVVQFAHDRLKMLSAERGWLVARQGEQMCHVCPTCWGIVLVMLDGCQTPGDFQWRPVVVQWPPHRPADWKSMAASHLLHEIVCIGLIQAVLVPAASGQMPGVCGLPDVLCIGSQHQSSGSFQLEMIPWFHWCH